MSASTIVRLALTSSFAGLALATGCGGDGLFWDGVGWTVQAIRSGTPSLYGLWASPLPEGRVFAVGINGTIITGP